MPAVTQRLLSSFLFMRAGTCSCSACDMLHPADIVTFLERGLGAVLNSQLLLGVHAHTLQRWP